MTKPATYRHRVRPRLASTPGRYAIRSESSGAIATTDSLADARRLSDDVSGWAVDTLTGQTIHGADRERATGATRYVAMDEASEPAARGLAA